MKSIFRTFLISTVLGLVFIMPNLVYASNTASKSDACQGVSIISGNSSCDSLKSSQSSLSSILGLVLNLLSVIVGLVAVIMIIIGGLKYVTSSGNSERTNEAKNTILYAIIGLVIVAIAQIIVRFVIHKA